MTPGRQDRPGGKKVHGGVSRARSRGFTLIEVLVVIGIIAVLAALLIPIVGKVHQAAYQASTQSEITQIVSACHNYYEDFRAYPGPVSNSEIESLSITTTPSSYSQYCDIAISSTGGSSGPQQLLNGGTTAQPTPVLGFFTGSENLVLGLLGGLWHNPNNGNNTLEFVNGTPPGVTTYTNPPTLIGTGPRSLATGSSSGYSTTNKQYTAYLSTTFPGSTLLLNGDGTPEDGINPYHYGGIVSWSPQTFGNGKFFNTIVPVFTDQYPDHLPILYLRARVGAHGILSGPANNTTSPLPYVTDPTTGVTPGPTAHYNYDLAEIIPFTLAGLVGTPAPGLGPTSGGIVGFPGQHGLQYVYVNSSNTNYLVYDPPGTALPTTPAYNYPVPTNFVANAGQYFMNLSIQPTNQTSTPTCDYINATGTPRAKDEFILISAGKDRTYGTSDDITSFGDVEP